ncbi:hypothetical protein FDECE_15881 [Fusarium decemcellulare]|nr:hypothetical protein FDECE_15881 [Fusarium decemcellulare]
MSATTTTEATTLPGSIEATATNLQHIDLKSNNLKSTSLPRPLVYEGDIPVAKLRRMYRQMRSEPPKSLGRVVTLHPNWYACAQGIERLFTGLGLSEVQEYESGNTRFYSSTTEKPNEPRHILQWGEEHHGHLLVISKQESRVIPDDTNLRKGKILCPTKRPRGMRREMNILMNEVAYGVNRGKHLAHVFNVIKVTAQRDLAVWHLIRKKDHTGTKQTSATTKTEPQNQ